MTKDRVIINRTHVPFYLYDQEVYILTHKSNAFMDLLRLERQQNCLKERYLRT